MNISKTKDREYFISVGQGGVMYTLRISWREWKGDYRGWEWRDGHVATLSSDIDKAKQKFVDMFDDVQSVEQVVVTESTFAKRGAAGTGPKYWENKYVNGKAVAWFGRYYGKPFTEIEDMNYLCWMATENQGLHDRHKNFINKELLTEYVLDNGAEWIKKNPWDLEDMAMQLLHGERLQKAKERASAVETLRNNAQWIGTVGQSVDLFLTVKRTIDIETQYGDSTLYIMEDAIGNTFTKFGTINERFIVKKADPEAYGINDGDELAFNADVKDHNERNGIKQTQLGRVRKIKAAKAKK